MGSNVVMLVGKLIEITKTELVIKLTDGEDIIPIVVSKNIIDSATTYSQVGNIMGVKGRVKNQDGRVIIEGDRISFLSSNAKGGE